MNSLYHRVSIRKYEGKQQERFDPDRIHWDA